ncbi:Activator of Hsp90 ATPase 1 family protein [Catenulispora acidiphila DSM 44928]|uniref:Activator of Hsp90 ATPase 1 family protein n=1 Tax=Catenulispora acidiphila (strain DSM 44928 / JCM 14897 / NBRC 102108 / NRRL B-24433 / ID139908) TaxID=479433 RepID=C7QDY1_CATAD|nr:SRPBCC family protein [Catenulispora acidiphila]ACU76569.1 Activator of Hsp90 ATPase 1 family protein [Catenulispora acidiphila DSM 44928]
MSTTPDTPTGSKPNPTIIEAPEGTPFLDITRDFDAAPAQVFRAYTEPKLVARWLGPRDLEMDIEEYDARPGGRYRYVHHGGHLGEVRAGFRGVFHTVEADRLIIQTFEFEGVPNEVKLDICRFSEVDGKTRVTTRSVFPSMEAREGALASGMKHGIQDSMERLTELLAEGV